MEVEMLQCYIGVAKIEEGRSQKAGGILPSCLLPFSIKLIHREGNKYSSKVLTR